LPEKKTVPQKIHTQKEVTFTQDQKLEIS
jgi:hypothetical protein